MSVHQITLAEYAVPGPHVGDRIQVRSVILGWVPAIVTKTGDSVRSHRWTAPSREGGKFVEYDRYMFECVPAPEANLRGYKIQTLHYVDCEEQTWRTIPIEPAARFVFDGFSACLPPGAPLPGRISKARFTGKERAVAVLVLFDGRFGEVEVAREGPRKAWVKRWLDTGGGDLWWTGHEWKRRGVETT
ncbi:MAG: hypothetical protein ACOY93_08515 [Bacillota bacterium]